MLLQAGADPLARGGVLRESLLHYAAKNGVKHKAKDAAAIMKRLLQMPGVSKKLLEGEDLYGRTPLFAAAEAGNAAALELLLQAGMSALSSMLSEKADRSGQ